MNISLQFVLYQDINLKKYIGWYKYKIIYNLGEKSPGLLLRYMRVKLKK